MIIIDGTPDDTTAMLVKQRVEANGVEARLLETTQFPRTIKLSYDPEHIENGVVFLPGDSQAIRLGDIKGVYRRGSNWILTPHDTELMSGELLYWNIESTLGSMYRLLDCKWVNPLMETNDHRHKAFQLKQMVDLGIRIPDTLVSNNIHDLRDFYDKHAGNIIIKYPQGGTNTRMVTKEELLDSKFIAHLNTVPVKFQSAIEGTDIRVYVFDEQVFPLEIHSEEIDFRKTPLAFRKKIDLPKDIHQKCIRLRETFQLKFIGIDIKRTEDGQHFFFEGNPTPVFLYDEIATGYPISETIANYLTE